MGEEMKTQDNSVLPSQPMTGRSILLGIFLVPLAAFAVGLFSWVVWSDDPPRAPAAFNAQADCKSGAGCCRPRVQDGDPKIECNDDDWRRP
jgi:hypothetical protein